MRAVSKPGVVEDTEHGVVLRQDLGDELLDPGFRRVRGEPLEQTRPDSAPVQVVCDRKGNLGPAWVMEANVGRERDGPDDPTGGCELAEQRGAVFPVGLEGPGDRGVIDRRRTVEPEVAAVGRERLEEVDQGRFVGGGRYAQPKCRAVAQHDVFHEMRSRV